MTTQIEILEAAEAAASFPNAPMSGHMKNTVRVLGTVLRSTISNLLAALLTIAAFELAAFASAGLAYAQTPSPVVIKGMFETDLPDVTQQGKDQLGKAVEKAVDAARHDGCYPPRVTVTVVVGNNGDPAFTQPLADARVGDLPATLSSLGLDTTQFAVPKPVASTKRPLTDDGDDVTVSYGPFASDKDTDPPVLEVHSVAPKGSKVSPGQQITLTIKASERYQDGHKSWPSGVQVTQLTDDAGLVHAWEYPRPPPPCAVREVKWDYKVPDNPPPIVHLTVLTENGSGGQNVKTADFPTGDMWKGTMKISTNAPDHFGGRCSDSWTADIEVVVSEKGVASGGGTARRASEVCGHPHSCPGVQEYTYNVTGEGDRQSLRLKFRITRASPPGSCDYTGFGLLFTGSPAARINTIPLTGVTRAEANFGVSAGGGGFSGSIDAALNCVTCNTASNR